MKYAMRAGIDTLTAFEHLTTPMDILMTIISLGRASAIRLERQENPLKNV